jgi:TRAP-type transport system periplasmic protein
MRKLIAVVLACALAAPAVAEPAELKFASFVGRMHRVDVHLITPMEQAWEGLVNGASKIVVYAGGELLPGVRPQYEGVVDGTADFTFSMAAYAADAFPNTLMFELPGLYSDPVKATEAVWDNMDFVQKDFAGLQIVGLWFNDPTVLITRDKPVSTLNDIRGLKIRATSPAHARILKSWGAIPVSLPLNKVYDALGNAEIDGVFIAGSAIESFKFFEVAHFATINLPESVAAMYIAMNKARYDSLTDIERQAIDSFSGRESSLDLAHMYQEDASRAIQFARENGVQIIELNEFQRKAFEDRFPYSQTKIGE